MTDNKTITWKKRNEAASQQDAVAALADFLSSSDGICIAIRDRSSLDEVEQFAQKWSVPFSRELIVQMMRRTDQKRWDGDTPAICREDYESDEEYKEALELDEEYGELRATHYWMSSSETAMC